MSIRRALVLFAAVLSTATPLWAADADLPITANRPLRYHPDGTDFVIDNGQHFFNRPLYGPNTAFHTDGGDKPEFALINSTNKDGVLRIALVNGDKVKWLAAADHITTRYRAGSLIYDVRDSLLGDATLQITAISAAGEEGVVLKTQTTGATSAELLFVYGGITKFGGTVSNVRAVDENGGRDLQPQLMLHPQDCQGNAVTADGNKFSDHNGAEAVAGAISSGEFFVTGSDKLATPSALLALAKSESPLAVARAALSAPIYFALTRGNAQQQADLRARFDAAEAHRRSIAEMIVVDTPDAYINTIPGALAIAADACWNPPYFVHGAISWRSRLLGWRGPYMGDAIGWHDRASAYLAYWAGQQNTSDDFPTVAVPNPARELSENDGKMLHSNGSIPQSHYDMNMVYMDILMRHLLWTGDVAVAKKLWPTIKLHLAWEKRLFDRDGLYEAYAAIWASDALEYDGGGVAHSTAYNEFANRMAGRVAHLIGEDATPYEKEADRIHQAMQSRLWMADRGWYAEYQDTLGEKQLHPAAALWTIYHTIDSRVPDTFQSWQSLRYVDNSIPHIPVRGNGVPDGNYSVVSESNWMPYEWSLNNVVTGETAHMALANWEGGRAEEGFRLLKSSALDTMYCGMTPGDIPNLSAYDINRGESYTDFGDPIGITSRALIEGLFGIQPDAIAGTLTIRPGFPREWDHTSIKAHDLSYAFKLEGNVETWTVDSRFAQRQRLVLHLPARGVGVDSITVNGQAAKWTNIETSIETPAIEIAADAAAHFEVAIHWRAGAMGQIVGPKIVAAGTSFTASVAPAQLLDISDPQSALAEIQKQADSVTAKATGLAGHRTAFAKVKQGDFTWWLPIEFEIRPGLQVVQTAVQDAQAFHIRLRNNTPTAIDGSVTFAYADVALKTDLHIPAFAESAEIPLKVGGALPGTTRVHVESNVGQTDADLLDWAIHPQSAPNLEAVGMAAKFNDSVTRIFLNEYLTPRPQTCSLQIPLHLIGEWTHPNLTYAVDDSGIRKAAVGGKLNLPQGIFFQTPGGAGDKNILFTSQFDNYPRRADVPLSGRASHAWFLVAGSTTTMESRLENGEIVVAYADGSTERLPLINPENWWPIEKNYHIDDYAFPRPGPVPLRVSLRTAEAYLPEDDSGSPGGSATVLDLPLNSGKELKSVTLHCESYEIVMGLMGVTLQRTP